MKKNLLLILLLAGCSTVSEYYPTLSSKPKDPAKYEADHTMCIAEVKQRGKAAIDSYYSDGRWLMNGFGIAGGAVNMATSDSSKDYNKDGRTMMDECMASKGYPVIKAQHCC